MSYIKKFYVGNKILMIILYISIFAIIKFSDVPLLSWLPELLKSVFLKPNEGTLQYDFFKFAENMSLAYISGLIFYILIEYVPSQKNADKSYEIIKNNLKNLYSRMSTVVSIVLYFESIDKEVSHITIEDCAGISTTNYDLDVHYLKSTAFINGLEKAPTNFSFTFELDMPNYSKAIFRYISDIKNSAAIVNVEFEIIELISAIEACGFTNQLAWFQNAWESGYGEFHQYGDKFYEFLDLYRRLEEFPFDKHTYRIRALSDDEIESLLKFRSEFSKSPLIEESKNFKKIINGQIIE